MKASVREIVSSHLNAIKEGIIVRMARLGRNASGRTVRSLEVNATATGGYLEGAGNFLYLEHGRGPGKVPRGFYDIIREWVIAKGISYHDLIPQNGTPEQGLARLSGAIAYSIMKNGTKLYREHRHDEIYSELMEKELELLSQESSGVFEAEVEKLQEIELDKIE